MAIHGRTRDRVITALQKRESFRNTTGHFRAVQGRGLGTGQMEGDDLARYQADDVTYTVYSYKTPIAWVTRAGLVRISTATYSQTTRQHIGLCRVYL